MSSVVTPVNGDIVTVHVIKHLFTNPGAKWSNTYDFKIVDASSGTLFTGITLQSLDFERRLTLNTVHFDELRVSTFLPDSRPYNPEAFLTFPVDEAGLISPSGDPLPLGYAWLILRNTAAGRPGKIFLRGGLTEDSVNSAGGMPTFTNPTARAADLTAAIGGAGMSVYIDGTSPDAKLVVPHYDKATHVLTSRDVNALTSRNAILAKLSRKRKHHILIHTG